MLVFPNCKINLGLNVIEKREDGFHNIETVFYPVNWREGLEIIEESGGKDFDLKTSGIPIKTVEKQGNILYKAWQLVKKDYPIPPVKIYLHKIIPMGAGLGGGSADAAFFLKAINQKFELGIAKQDLLKMAASLGSDCSFFIENRPVFACQKGDVFENIEVDLSKFYILVVYPGVHSNTKEAYEGLVPAKPSRSIKNIITNEPVEKWKGLLVNDFEKSIFKKYPETEKLKRELYEKNAIYASMSGSGSAVFGLFKKKPTISFLAHYPWHLKEPDPGPTLTL
jgi:4-diphosphocytidyl-2-C-methyl-D-erythritol kinase